MWPLDVGVTASVPLDVVNSRCDPKRSGPFHRDQCFTPSSFVDSPMGPARAPGRPQTSRAPPV
eukprot:5090314-Pyramimonas_sp.AAC.1